MDSKGVHKSLGRFELMMLSWRKTNKVRAKRKTSSRTLGLVLPLLLAWLLPSLASAAIVHEETLTYDSLEAFVGSASVTGVGGSVHYVTTHTRNRVLSSEDADYTQRAYLDNTASGAGGAGSRTPSRGGKMAP